MFGPEERDCAGSLIVSSMGELGATPWNTLRQGVFAGEKPIPFVQSVESFC